MSPEQVAKQMASEFRGSILQRSAHAQSWACAEWYLGAILTSKLDFNHNTLKTIKKARQRLHIVSKLYHLGVNEKLIKTCYKSFIESIITYHLVLVYSHMNAYCKRKLKYVIKTSEYLAGDLVFISAKDLKTKSLRMIATDNEPILELYQLPSGRYQTVRYRVQLRAKCFRSECIKYLNTIFRK